MTNAWRNNWFLTSDCIRACCLNSRMTVFYVTGHGSAKP